MAWQRIFLSVLHRLETRYRTDANHEIRLLSSRAVGISEPTGVLLDSVRSVRQATGADSATAELHVGNNASHSRHPYTQAAAIVKGVDRNRR